MSLSERAQCTDRFSFSNPPLLFARARLFTDRLELTGWQLQGRYRRDLSIRHILQIDALADDRLVLWLASGETVRLRIRQARQWKTAIEQQQARM
ncbi:MAG TPA: hypothetical protein VKP65_18795 [Rhodothermales bacterium]|nr:hypothetical protein [Rhodothermales bacterium]